MNVISVLPIEGLHAKRAYIGFWLIFTFFRIELIFGRLLSQINFITTTVLRTKNRLKINFDCVLTPVMKLHLLYYLICDILNILY